MKTCTKCGSPIADEDDTDSGLDFLGTVSSLVGGEEEDPPLCTRCREERRLTGAAIFDDRMLR